jgi:hypothetical protein
MIRNHMGKLIKINKNDFSSEKKYYEYYIKHKYNIEFKKQTDDSLKKNMLLKIKNMQKNYS